MHLHCMLYAGLPAHCLCNFVACRPSAATGLSIDFCAAAAVSNAPCTACCAAAISLCAPCIAAISLSTPCIAAISLSAPCTAASSSSAPCTAASSLSAPCAALCTAAGLSSAVWASLRSTQAAAGRRTTCPWILCWGCCTSSRCQQTWTSWSVCWQTASCAGDHFRDSEVASQWC